jgi:hypothetical protein
MTWQQQQWRRRRKEATNRNAASPSTSADPLKNLIFWRGGWAELFIAANWFRYYHYYRVVLASSSISTGSVYATMRNGVTMNGVNGPTVLVLVLVPVLYCTNEYKLYSYWYFVLVQVQ